MLGLALVAFMLYGMVLTYPHPLSVLWGIGAIVALAGWRK